MASLFKTLSKLTRLKAKNNFNTVQRDFILKILEGNEQWSRLEIMAGTTDIKQLNSLKAALEDERGKTHFISFQSPYWNYKYIKNLKSVLADVQGTLDQINHIKTYSTKESEKYNKSAKRMDTLYKQTMQTYHGTIMLPVNQVWEPRMGNSGGECFGYVAKWAVQILKNKRPFGLHVNQQQTLKPILFSSSLARKYPGLNHLAVFTKEISIYQELQSSVAELIKNLSNFKVNSNQYVSDQVVDYKKNLHYAFYTSTIDLAHSLVKEADKDPSKVYNLNIMNYMAGHALGFCLIDKKYHFFDSNSGWYRFDKDEDFINWFPYYYKQRGYTSNYFNEYAISAYSLSKNSNNEPNKKESISWVAVTILSPIIAALIIGLLINHFIIRGFRYLNIMVNEYFDLKNKQPEKEEVDSISDSTLVEILPKSLEALDLAVNLNGTKKKVSQAENVLDYLDLSKRDHFKNSGSNAFFKELKLVKSEVEVGGSQDPILK